MSDDEEQFEPRATRASPLAELERNLRAGLSVALFGAPRGFVVSWTQFVLLCLLELAATLVGQMVYVGLPGQLTLWGLPDALFGIPLLLLAAWAIAALARRPEETLSLAIAVVSAVFWLDLVLIVAAWGARDAAPRMIAPWLSWIVYYAGILWYLACLLTAGARMFGLSWPRRLASAAIAIAVIGYPAISGNHERTLWTKAYEEEAAPKRAAYDAAASEEVLYQQPKLLETELASLLPRRPGRPNLYLVSVAGYADQDVFLREVNSVDALFAERFGTRGRSVRLMNNRGTVRTSPLATRTSIREALQRVGSIINPEEDVLFLFLTSHGSKDGRLSIQFHPFRFADLTAPELRQMLDDAGIRNRVVVVSSCYSGTFVDALRDDNTLVMTASAKDRNSFGCSNEADFTYFGKAYFDEALRSTDSFSDAFDTALPVIAAREKKDDYTPSDPQRFAGANIEAKLAAWREANARAPER